MFSGKKLSEQMKLKNFTNKSLVERLNDMGIKIGEDSFKSYRQDRANPRIEVLCGIADALGILEQDLFDRDTGTTFKRRKPTTNLDQSTLKSSVVSIPIFMEGTYHNDIYDLISDDNIYIEIRRLKNCYKDYKNIIAIQIDGDTATPENNLKEDDVFLIQLIQNREFSKIDGLYLVRYGNIMQIKKVQFLGNDEIKLISLNPEYPPINPSKDLGNNWEIIGKVIIKINIDYYECIKCISKGKNQGVIS